MQYFVSLVFLVSGFLFVRYTFPLVKLFGRMGWAETHFGVGGTHFVWRMMGAGLIIMAFVIIRYPEIVGLGG